MKCLIVGILVFFVLAAAPRKQKFTGTITDNMCATGDHSRMRMGPTNAACTIACVQSHDASYVLYDGKEVYMLSDQRTPEKFAGRRVNVTGSVELSGRGAPGTRTIHVDSIAAAH